MDPNEFQYRLEAEWGDTKDTTFDHDRDVAVSDEFFIMLNDINAIFETGEVIKSPRDYDNITSDMIDTFIERSKHDQNFTKALVRNPKPVEVNDAKTISEIVDRFNVDFRSIDRTEGIKVYFLESTTGIIVVLTPLNTIDDTVPTCVVETYKKGFSPKYLDTLYRRFNKKRVLGKTSKRSFQSLKKEFGKKI
ncbi:TPA: hypothetical protein GX533_00060 [Candidatus Dojkabacteria bacterium]|uniref:Uncharacterized protein n=1 Tax=Candidatus Dojkabacteria bacterium TaxID=2099670 RepID=A0A832QB49_9BACT|nr:hypothetical protein [Candidatus Dojkabacteria bacterium]